MRIHARIKPDRRIKIVDPLVRLLGKASRPQLHLISSKQSALRGQRTAKMKRLRRGVPPPRRSPVFRSLNLLFIEQRLDLDRQAEQVDKARGIGLVIDMVLAEGGDLLRIQRMRRSHAGIDDVALVELELHIARDRLPVSYTHLTLPTNREVEISVLSLDSI